MKLQAVNEGGSIYLVIILNYFLIVSAINYLV